MCQGLLESLCSILTRTSLLLEKSFTFPGKAYTCAGTLCISQKFHKKIIHVSLRRTYIIDVIYMLYTKTAPLKKNPVRTWSSCSKNMLCFHQQEFFSPILSNQEEQRDKGKYTSSSIPSQRSHQSPQLQKQSKPTAELCQTFGWC